MLIVDGIVHACAAIKAVVATDCCAKGMQEVTITRTQRHIEHDGGRTRVEIYRIGSCTARNIGRTKVAQRVTHAHVDDISPVACVNDHITFITHLGGNGVIACTTAHGDIGIHKT